jgi:mono/diheme cytochrome c family protein
VPDIVAFQVVTKLNRQHCAECHGANGLGTDRAPHLHAPEVQPATPGELEWFLRNGNLLRGTPSWSGIPEQRRCLPSDFVF